MFDFDVRATQQAGEAVASGRMARPSPWSLVAGMALSRVPTRAPLGLAPALEVGVARQRMRARQAAVALVASDGLLLGLVEEADLAQAAGRGPSLPVWRVMRPCPAPLLATDTVAGAIGKLADQPRLPRPLVNPHGAVIGLLALTDLTAWLTRRGADTDPGFVL